MIDSQQISGHHDTNQYSLFWIPWLLHSPMPVAVGCQWVGYETWPPNGWHYPFVIGWSECKWELLQSQWTVGSRDLWEFPPFFRDHWQSPYPGGGCGCGGGGVGGVGGCGGVLTIFWVTGRLGPFDPPFSTYVEFLTSTFGVGCRILTPFFKHCRILTPIFQHVELWPPFSDL